MSRLQSGFSLIEIAIVLVIIGLMMGGSIKGQELIANARVRNLVGQMDDVKAAYFGFTDRYRALPGDYAAATTSIPNCGSCENGNGNGQILTHGTTQESIAAWTHLSRAQFLSGSYRYTAGDAVSPDNTPMNPYGAPLQLIYDNNYVAGGSTVRRHNLKTGNNLPSDILSEIDRKVDDGRATGGQFRFSSYGPSSAIAACTLTSGEWNAANPETNCSAVTLL